MGGRSIGALLGVAWRRRFLLLGVSILVFAGCMSVILNIQPAYRADSILILPSVPAGDPRAPSANPVLLQTDPFVIQSELDVLTSPEMARRVIDRLDLKNVPGFIPEPSLLGRASAFIRDMIRTDAGLGRSADPSGAESAEGALPADTDAEGAYLQNLYAFNSGRATTVHLSFTSRDPVLATRIVNTHAEIYVDMQSERRVQAQARVADLLTQELSQRRQSLDSAEAALRKFRTEGGAAAPDRADEGSQLALAADAARSAVSRTTSRLTQAQQILNEGVLQSAGFVASDAKIVSPATIPRDKAFPRTGLLALMSLVVSSIVGIGAAAGAEWWANRGQRACDHLRGMGVRPLGILPIAGNSTGYPRRGMQRAVFWEQIRFVREFLSSRHRQDSVVVLVTSALPGEGKSTVAAALAQAYAATGRRTLLIDGDLRRPSVTETFGAAVRDHPGLSDTFLITAGRAGNSIVSVADNLDLMPAGVGDRDVDGLASIRFRLAMKNLRRTYQVLVVDSSPLAAAADALSIAAVADETILVTHATKTPRPIVDDTLETLRSCGIQLAGFVATGLSPKRSGVFSRREMQRYFRGRALDAPRRVDVAGAGLLGQARRLAWPSSRPKTHEASVKEIT